MSTWGAAFVAARFSHQAPPGVVAGVDQLLARCEKALPQLAELTGQFVERLVELAPDVTEVEPWLETLNAEELYLAWACGTGSDVAIGLFERRYLKTARAAIVRLRLSNVELDEVMQALATHLLVADKRKPRIASYEGVGPLASWVRSAATRLAISKARRLRPQTTDELEALTELEVATGDPELDLIRQRFRTEFKAIFPQALATLTAEDRTLLRLHHIDEVPLDKIGLLFSLHKSNVSRRLSRVRAELLETTRALMRQHLRVDETQLDSLMRLVDDDLNLSLETFLR